MEIIKLEPGRLAPEDSDCISILDAPGGKFALNASVLVSCGDGEEVESVAMIGGDPYDSYDDAESAGLAWVASHCIEQVYISTMAGSDT